MADDDGSLVTVPPGGDVAPNLPPVELPKTDDAAPVRPRIKVNPSREKPPPAENWGPDDTKPPADVAAHPAPEAHDDWGPDDTKPPPPEPPLPKVGQAEAAGRGALDMLTAGTAPALAGIAQAGGEGTHPAIYDIYKAISNAVSSHPDPQVSENFHRGQQDYLKRQQAGQEQNPWSYLGGQFLGAVASSGLGSMGVNAASGAIGRAAASIARAAPGALGRIGQSVAGGTLAGGAYGAGTAIGEGHPEDVLSGGAKGALMGAGFGAAGAGLAEGVGAAASRIGGLGRGLINPESEAARRIAGSIRSDWETTGRPMDAEALAAADVAGTPRAIVDIGGERTRALARAAANVSPEARQSLTEMTSNRFEGQSPRVAGFIRNITGGANAGADQDTLETMARRANKPAYAAAYQAGDRPIWSPELEQLAGAPALGSAMAGAVQRGKNRAIVDHMGAFRPQAKVTPDGRVIFHRGPKGVPTYPNLQFWDYTQRELRDMAESAKRAGRREEGSALSGLHSRLNAELDRLVPEFNNARAGAKAFFKAQDASEAGANFAKGTNTSADLHEANKAIRKMSAPERELFARGFATELANKVEGVRDRSNVINHMFLDSPRARQQVEMALGPQRARQLEALLRVEAIVDRARTALGNSTTARQLKEMGMAAAHSGIGHGAGSAGLLAGYEALHEHEFNPSHLVGAALLGGLAKRGVHVIDERVARRMGEILASDDPAVLAKGIQQVARTPWMLNGLRYGLRAAGRVGAHDIGPGQAAAAIRTLPEIVEPEEPSHLPDESNQNFAHGGTVRRKWKTRQERVKATLARHGVSL